MRCAQLRSADIDPHRFTRFDTSAQRRQLADPSSAIGVGRVQGPDPGRQGHQAAQPAPDTGMSRTRSAASSPWWPAHWRNNIHGSWRESLVSACLVRNGDPARRLGVTQLAGRCVDERHWLRFLLRCPDWGSVSLPHMRAFSGRSVSWRAICLRCGSSSRRISPMRLPA